MAVHIKRIYESKAAEDGYRILVDRLWPRGIKKEDAGIDLWLKEVAPSTALRNWFHKDTGNWDEFSLKYHHELKYLPEIENLKEVMKSHEQITLLYAAKNEAHNHAMILRDFILNLTK